MRRYRKTLIKALRDELKIKDKNLLGMLANSVEIAINAYDLRYYWNGLRVGFGSEYADRWAVREFLRLYGFRADKS